jgi:hypothetical protein
MSMEMLAQVLRFSNPQLSRAEHKLLVVLAYHTNHETGLAYPGHRRLAQELLITERQVKNLVRRLVKAGWIEVNPGQGRGHLSVYRLTLPPDDVIHRKGEISQRPIARKGEILRPEKGKFCVAPNKEVEPTERNLQAGARAPIQDRPLPECLGYSHHGWRYCDRCQRSHHGSG